MKLEAVTTGGVAWVMKTTLFLVSLCGVSGVHAGDVKVTVEGAAIQISSSRSENVVLDATGSVPFKLEFVGLDDDLYRLWWRDKKDRRRLGPLAFTPTEGRFTADLPEAPNGISIRVTPLKTFEKEISDALGTPLTYDVEQLKLFGDYYRTEAKPDLGLVEYGRIIERFPDDKSITPDAFVGRAICLLKLKDYAAALGACDALVSKYGSSEVPKGDTGIPVGFWALGNAKRLRGLIYEYRQKWDRALIEYQDELAFYRDILTQESYPPDDWRSGYVEIRDRIIPERIARMKLLLSPELAVERIYPAESDFLSKRIVYAGIPIKAHGTVDNRALQEAANRLIQELGRIPEIAYNLAQAGAQLHIIGDHQDPTDLPYLRWWKGRPYDGQLTMDERTRGVGGLTASCGEENLLRLDSDPYVEHRDICMHEFAHTIQDHAMPRDVRQMIRDQFTKSIDKGLWKNMYAASNSGEFFAELTMWYFGTRGDTGRAGNIKPPSTEGPEWLKSYDPEAYDLLDRFYSGKIPIAKSEFTNLPAHPKEEESQLRSGADDTETQIMFDNKTDNKYSLFWIDAEGKRNPYESVEPHAKNTQSTFAGHVWLVADPEGNTVALYVAEEKPGVAGLE